MNLDELYEQTPVRKHSQIKVIGNQVYIIDGGVATLEYLIDDNGELISVYSGKKLRDDIRAIKRKLGA